MEQLAFNNINSKKVFNNIDEVYTFLKEISDDKVSIDKQVKRQLKTVESLEGFYSYSLSGCTRNENSFLIKKTLDASFIYAYRKHWLLSYEYYLSSNKNKKNNSKISLVSLNYTKNYILPNNENKYINNDLAKYIYYKVFNNKNYKYCENNSIIFWGDIENKVSIAILKTKNSGFDAFMLTPIGTLKKEINAPLNYTIDSLISMLTYGDIAKIVGYMTGKQNKILSMPSFKWTNELLSMISGKLMLSLVE